MTRRRHRRSVTTRLVVTLAVTLTAVIMVGTTVSILFLRSYIAGQIDNRLINTSLRIRASLLGLRPVILDVATAESMAKPENAAVVGEHDGRIALTANTDPATAALLVAVAKPDGRPHPVPGRPGMAAIRLDTLGTDLTLVDAQGRRLSADALVIGFDTGPTLATAQRLILVISSSVLVCILALVAATVIIVSRSLRPLRTMAERAHAFAAGDRTVRLPVPADDPEMERLALTVNEAFDVQQRAEGRLRAFVADASHELRTPLTTATGWIELYLQGGLDDQTRRDQAMQRAMTQLDRMRVLIDELALLARLDRARPLDLHPVDLTALTAEVLEDARVINPDRHFCLRASGPATVLGDAPKLQQVLQNLFGNAVQHTPPGTPVDITVRPASAQAESGHPGMHAVLVSDRGPGIAKEDQEHVFTRFWRGDASRTRHTGGVGLGLAIVSSIVTAHGGTSEVISQPGRGTTIRLLLPATGPLATERRTRTAAASVLDPGR